MVYEVWSLFLLVPYEKEYVENLKCLFYMCEVHQALYDTLYIAEV